MASANVSLMPGDADSNIDERSSLLASLRARFGSGAAAGKQGPDFNSEGLALVPPKEEASDDSIAYLSDFLFAHAQDAASTSTGDALRDEIGQIDRGIDARQKVLSALKNQLSTALEPVAMELAPAAPGGPPIIDLEIHEPELAGQQWTFTDVGLSPDEEEALNELEGEASDLIEAAREPLLKRIRPNPKPVAPAPPPLNAAESAEAAELAARKAAMLRSLQAAETMGQAEAAPGAPPSSHLQGAATQTAMAGGSGASRPPAQPDMSGCPAGSSPEQYEAYRKKCWEQYYEYTTVWKKYYNQNQAEQSGKGGSSYDPGKGKGKGKPPAPAAQHVGHYASVNPAVNPGHALALRGLGASANAGPPRLVPVPAGAGGKGGGLLRPLPNGASLGAMSGLLPSGMTSGSQAVAAANALAAGRAGQGAVVVPPPKRPEEDIHSKLLGL